MAAPKKTEKQVMDVSKPGKTPADPSARPVIVGHKPMVQDPMVTETEDETVEAVEEPQAETEEKPAVSPSASKRIIAPLSAEEKSVDDTEADEESQPVAEETVSEDSIPAKTKNEDSATSDAAVVDAVVDQVADKKKVDEQQEADERKKREALEKLVAEKKYFIPLGRSHHTSGHGLLVFTVLLGVAFLGLVAAIDAGMLEAGFTLPFDLIK